MVDRSHHIAIADEDDLSTTSSLEDRTPDDDFFAPTVSSRAVDSEIMGPRLTVLPEGCTRGEAIQTLSREIPLNQYGLPAYFIRSDLLSGLALGHVDQEEIDAASMGLFYTEGYPTLEDGRAFWNQLPHEDPRAFNYFQRYLEQAEEHGIRQLDVLGATESIDSNKLRQLYMEFYWSSRARAYDLFQVAAQERKRQLRIRSMENRHYDLAGKRMEELLRKFEDEEWIEEVNAAEALELLMELAKLQRLSLGLTGQNASSLPKNALPEGASPQAIMEHLTKGTHLGEDQSDNFQAKLSALLNGDGGMEIQDAIIRFSRSENAHQAKPFGMDD
jgi:hypothetical protein